MDKILPGKKGENKFCCSTYNVTQASKEYLTLLSCKIALASNSLVNKLEVQQKE